MTATLPITEASLFLVVAQGAHRGAMIPVKGPQFLIGRHPTCHMRPTSQSVSSCHCALLAREGRFFVSDLNSATGTFLNERQIVGEVEVLDQDQLRAGPLQLVIRLPGGSAAPKAEPNAPQLDTSAEIVTDVDVVPEDDAALTTTDNIPVDEETAGLTEASAEPAEAPPAPPEAPPVPEPTPPDTASHRARAILRRYSARRQGH